MKRSKCTQPLYFRSFNKMKFVLPPSREVSCLADFAITFYATDKFILWHLAVP